MKHVFPFFLIALSYCSASAQGAGSKTGPAGDSSRRAKVLHEVIVTSKKKLIEQKADRTIVNVDAMITAAGGDALEVLSKSPGVIVDMNGNISLNGRHGVLVLIDDRPTYMSTQQLADYLRSLPAGALDRVELMSNPPARYDASGNAIINIILKKNRARGFNGNVSAGWNQGIYARINESINVNYRNTKYNLFGNASYGDSRNFNDNTDDRYFYNTGGSLLSSTMMSSRSGYRFRTWNARVGIDYFVSAKTTVGMMLTGYARPRTERLDYAGAGYDAALKPDSISNGYTSGRYDMKNDGINVNFQHKLGSDGKTLTADIDYIRYHSNGSKLSGDYAYLPDSSAGGSYERLFMTPSEVSIRSLKADYTHPLPGNARLEAGVKSSYVTNDNRLDWLDGSGGGFVADYSKSDHFIYSERINAAYATATKEWKRWSVSGGLRVELTKATGHQPPNPAVAEAAFTKRYASLFPSVFILYKLDSGGNHTLVLRGGYRVRRPGYQQLNPFLFYQDRYTYSSGYPGLSPEYSTNADLRYSYKDHVGITLGLSREQNTIFSIAETEGDLLISRPHNFPGRYFMGVIPSVSFSPVRWWTFTVNAVLLFYVNKGNGDSIQLIKNNGEHEVEVFNQFHFDKGWSAELSGFFPGSQTFGQTRSGAASYTISAGVQKSMWQNRVVVRLKADDIFQTVKRDSKTVSPPQLIAFHTGRSDSRQLGLSFSYRFGKEANARKRNHNSGGAGDEEKRAN